jgi:acetyltransferase
VKLNSSTVTHKNDVGGVKLSLYDADAVRTAFRDIKSAVDVKAGSAHFDGVSVQPMISPDGYELIVGSSGDSQFGPVLLFGLGGQLVEVFRDRALALPPLNTTLARRWIEQTQIFKALKGVRGRKPVDLSALEQLLVRFSQVVLEQTSIKEMEINPLLASPQGLVALDARVVLYAKEVNLAEVPKPAIRPYPLKYSGTLTLKDGTQLSIRPIRPEDEPQLARFHETLSEQSVYRRYFSMLKLESRIRHDRLTRKCFVDYDREMALIAERPREDNVAPEIVGVGRLVRSLPGGTAEVAAIVSDAFQHKGIGRTLVSRLIEFAQDENIETLTASVLAENPAMQKLLESEGFAFHDEGDPGVLEGELRLNPRV